MPQKRRTFQRLLGNRRYKKLFIISVEGSKTEPQYFALFNESESIVLVKCLKGKGTDSAPTHVLKRIESYLRKESLKKTDEAWIVVDKDNWTEDQLQKLLGWAKKSTNYGFALSNPNFEYWLLLHFEEGSGLTNSEECLTRLKKYLPNYNKEIDPKKIPFDLIYRAIARAKQKDRTPTNLPQIWRTTVYKLVDKILNSKTEKASYDPHYRT